jgi:DegV family protein with EDD domain
MMDEAKRVIVVDDAGDVPQELVEKLGIRVIHHPVCLDDVEIDRSKMTTDEFMTRVRGGAMPKTILINTAMFENLYSSLADQGYTEILSVHLTKAMSSTIDMARKAAEKFKDRITVRVVDSLCTSAGEGMLAYAAARLLNEGKSLEEAAQETEKARMSVGLRIVTGDLKYLAKWGRIGKAKALMGSMLKITPLLTHDSSGGIIPAGRARSDAQAIDIVSGEIQSAAGEGSDGTGLTVFIIYTDRPEPATRLKDKLASTYPEADVYVWQTNPTVSVYLAPGGWVASWLNWKSF